MLEGSARRRWVEQLVRTRLQEQVEGFSAAVGAHEDLGMAGVKSLDIIVVLSNLEQELNITMEDAFVAKGYTVSTMTSLVCAELERIGASVADATYD